MTEKLFKLGEFYSHDALDWLNEFRDGFLEEMGGKTGLFEGGEKE